MPADLTVNVTPFLNTSNGARLEVHPVNDLGDPVPATAAWSLSHPGRVSLAVSPDTQSCDVHGVVGQSGPCTVTAAAGGVTQGFALTVQNGAVAHLNGTFQLL